MVAYILLACIGAVGVLGLVAMIRIALTSIEKGRAERARLAARERLVAESRSNKQAAVMMPDAEPPAPVVAAPAPIAPSHATAAPAPIAPSHAAAAPAPRKPARAMTPVPIVPLPRGELTGVINLLDESAQFALQNPPAPPSRRPKASAPPFASPAPHPYERPAWADGVVPKRSQRASAPPPIPMARVESATNAERPMFPEARTSLERPRPPAKPAFVDAHTSIARPRVPKASAPPPPSRAPSAAPHIAPSQPTGPQSLVRQPARPPAAFARETIDAPATRIPVPPAPVHHAAPGQTRLPVPPLPAPPPRRTRSS